jgi:CRP-like cAMP-binding protein
MFKQGILCPPDLLQAWAISARHIAAQGALAKLLLFNRLDAQIQRKVVTEMFERNVPAGEILIKEGDTGLAATELYVVKSGKFEVRGMDVCSNGLLFACKLGPYGQLRLSSCCDRLRSQVLQRRQGQNVRVNMKDRGDCFGEISLMYDCPRSATVAATTDAVVWVLDRAVFRCVVLPGQPLERLNGRKRASTVQASVRRGWMDHKVALCVEERGSEDQRKN